MKHDLDPEAPVFVSQTTMITATQSHNEPITKLSTSKELKKKKIRWCPQLFETREIEASGYQYPTKSIREEIYQWTAQRNFETKRTKRHRD